MIVKVKRQQMILALKSSDMGIFSKIFKLFTKNLMIQNKKIFGLVNSVVQKR